MTRGDGGAATSSNTTWVVGLCLGLALAVPLVVAVIALHDPRWFPYADSAVLELRLRDIGTAHTPLVGAIGRFGGAQASHPGPLGLYALWPFWRAAGSSAWATTVGAVAIHLAAIGVALWLAARRGGVVLLVAMGAVLAVLVHGYGPALLADAWNPFVPVLWWVVFLLAVWSVLCDDVVLLPVAVLAGSFCAQSHVSYVASTVVLGVVALAYAILRARRAGTAASSRLRRAVIAAGVLGVVLWLPPLIDELFDSGNFSDIWNAFTDDTQVSLGLGRGVEILLIYLSPWSILSRDLGQTKIAFASGTFVPGLVLVIVWAVAAVVSWRRDDRVLRQLHLVLAIAILLAVVSCSRVVGGPLSYLFLWAWGISALMVLAVGWTVLDLIRAAAPSPVVRRVTGGVMAAAGALVLVMVVLATSAATDAQIDDPHISHDLGRLAQPTVAALRNGAAGESEYPRLLVTWVDPLNFGLEGFGLINELERSGFDVGATIFFRGAVTPHRVLEPKDATEVVHLAIGVDIQRWERKAGAKRVAYFDDRTDAERAEFARLRRHVIADMRHAGLKDQVPLVDGNLVTALYYDDQLPPRTKRAMRRMIDIGLDQAVFVAPVGPTTT